MQSIVLLVNAKITSALPKFYIPISGKSTICKICDCLKVKKSDLKRNILSEKEQ